MSYRWSIGVSTCALSLILASGCTKEPEPAKAAPAPVADPGTAEIPKAGDSGTGAPLNESKADNRSDGEQDQSPAQSPDAVAPSSSDEAPETKPSSTEESKTEVDDKDEEDE